MGYQARVSNQPQVPDDQAVRWQSKVLRPDCQHRAERAGLSGSGHQDTAPEPETAVCLLMAATGLILPVQQDVPVCLSCVQRALSAGRQVCLCADCRHLEQKGRKQRQQAFQNRQAEQHRRNTETLTDQAMPVRVSTTSIRQQSGCFPPSRPAVQTGRH